MPMTQKTITDKGTSYATLGMFVGPLDHTDTAEVDASALSSGEVDAKGYLKPGVPLTEGGALADGTAGEAIMGVVLEPVKVTDTDLASAETLDVVVGTIGQVKRAVIEDNLGRQLTAAEVEAFDAPACLLRLV